jgi:hypothetical protein
LGIALEQGYIKADMLDTLSAWRKAPDKWKNK